MNLLHPKKALLLNALTLIIIGLVSYVIKDFTKTALIPVFFGMILLVLNFAYDKNNKVVAHIGILVILIVFISLFKPLTSQIDKNDIYGILRVGIMQLVSLYSMACFISSFIKARKEQ